MPQFLSPPPIAESAGSVVMQLMPLIQLHLLLQGKPATNITAYQICIICKNKIKNLAMCLWH